LLVPTPRQAHSLQARCRGCSNAYQQTSKAPRVTLRL
jgi:hypothetical protein